jgi:hypothetical protein
MSLDWQRGELAAGLACYRKQEFFLAHEHWEAVWLKLSEPEKSFLQALIQTTAAFHHLQSGNPAGAISLLRRALRRFESSPEHFAGISVISLREEARQSLHALETTPPSIPSTFPRISPHP